MNIAITGATGLLGSSMVEFFIEKGYKVYALIKNERSSYKLNNIANKIYGDVNSKSDVQSFVLKSQPYFFVHLAAWTQVNESLKFPYEAFYTNTVGTLNVLEALRVYSDTQAIVIASSEKAYGKSNGVEFSEKSPLDGTFPYDASKAITEIICRAYKTTYTMPIATTRACNIYGKRDYNQNRLIPAIIHAYKTGETLVMRNSGEETREYIHVDDVVRAYDCILEYISKRGIEYSFNISSGERFKTSEIVGMVQRHLKGRIRVEVVKSVESENRKEFINTDLLRVSTGWRPAMRLEDSLGDIIQWYLKH